MCTHVWAPYIVRDKVLGLGSTDAITGDVGAWAGVIVTTYFGGRTIEKVARIFRRPETKDGDLMPVGLFVPSAKAWKAVNELMDRRVAQ